MESPDLEKGQSKVGYVLSTLQRYVPRIHWKVKRLPFLEKGREAALEVGKEGVRCGAHTGNPRGPEEMGDGAHRSCPKNGSCSFRAMPQAMLTCDPPLRVHPSPFLTGAAACVFSP